MMRGTSIGDHSSGDDSSDIRTVRTNTTNMFSQASTYYTNPTLPPHTILNHHDDDQTTLTDDVSSLDYTSPTSIMTNYESYSKFGAAPIYQNVIIPTTNAQRRALLQQAQHQASSNGNTKELLLNTIIEENTATTTTTSPTKVYHPPSFYKKNQRRPTSVTPSSETVIFSATKSFDDGSIMTDNLTNSSASRTSSSSNPATTIPVHIIQPKMKYTSVVASSTKATGATHGTDDPQPAVISPSSPPPTTQSATAFSIFKRMTASVGNSPLRNRSQSSSPVPVESGKMSTATTSTATTVATSSSTNSDSSNVVKSPTGTGSQPQPTRSLRNYMNTLAYKSRRGSPSPIPTGRITPPQAKKNSSGLIPISPTTSIHSATSNNSNSGPSKNTASTTSPRPQELIMTPIKSNSSNSNPVEKEDRSNINIPTEILSRVYDDDMIPTKKTNICPTTGSTITSTSTDGGDYNPTTTAPYINPTLKCVSSKLFLPSTDEMKAISPILKQRKSSSSLPAGISDTAVVVPKEYEARLNLDMIDHMTAGGNRVHHPSDPHHSKESFRLWTDEDSAFGTSWYSFNTSPFVGDQNDTNNTSIESILSATGGAEIVNVQPPTVQLRSGETLVVPGIEPSASAAKPMATPQVVTTILPSVIPPSGKLSLSLLQLKNLHRTASMGSTDDDGDTANQYPSMVSSEYEDEGATSTLSGTYNNPTDDCTTLGGGPSFDFSVSACVDDDNEKDPATGNAAVLTSRSNPIVYSNVGQAFSRRDMMPTKSVDSINNTVQPMAGSRLISPPQQLVVDRPQRRRSTSTGKKSLSSPSPSSLEVIDEHMSHDHVVPQQPESASTSETSPNNTAVDTMVILSLGESIAMSSNKNNPESSQGSGPTDGNNNQGKSRVIRKLDSIQIGIILLISIALAAIICATFCIVGSCQVGKTNNNNNNRALFVVAGQRYGTDTIKPMQHYLRTTKKVDTISPPVLPP